MKESARPPLDELVSLQQAIVAREGSTTGPGGAGGISIVDAALIGFGADSFRSMTLQIYPGDPTRVDTADITGFDNGSGEVSVSGAMKGGVVPAGVPYKILTLRPAIAEVHGVFTVLPSAPEIIEPDTTQDLSLSISTVEGIPVAATLTAGTITITRVRAGVEFIAVNGLACTAANGRIFYAYTFPSAGAVWQPGDEYKAVFSGQQVAVGATTYALSNIRCKGIIIDVVAAVGTIAAVEAKLDAVLVTTETGGTITTDGNEQDVYINNAPAGVYEPLKVQIDFTEQVAVGDVVILRTYYRIFPGGFLRKKTEKAIVGVQDPVLIDIDLEPNRFGIQVTLQQTVGGPQDYDWAVVKRD